MAVPNFKAAGLLWLILSLWPASPGGASGDGALKLLGRAPGPPREYLQRPPSRPSPQAGPDRGFDRRGQFSYGGRARLSEDKSLFFDLNRRVDQVEDEMWKGSAGLRVEW